MTDEKMSPDRISKVEMASISTRLANAEGRKERLEKQLHETKLVLQEKQLEADKLRLEVETMSRSAPTGGDADLRRVEDELLKVNDDFRQFPLDSSSSH